MKLSTTPIFKHTLIAPEGKVFNRLKMGKVFLSAVGEQDFTVGLGGKILTWSDMHFNHCEGVPEELWDECLGEALVDMSAVICGPVGEGS